MRRRAVLGAAAVVALALSPASFAGTASVDGNNLRYVAPAGETNHVLVVSDPRGARIVELNAPIVAGPGCVAVNANEAICTGGFFLRATVAVADLDDFVLHAIFANSAIVQGGAGNDTLNSTSNSVLLSGGPGDDTLEGGGGVPHRFRGGLGSDVMRGRGGDDTADYSERTAGVRVDFDGVADDGEPGEADVLIGMEHVIGGAGDDVIIGSDRFRIEFLAGRDGADVIIGRGGIEDNLLGGAGNDRLYGGAGFDFVFGGDGNDVVRGGPGSERVEGNEGSDIVDGGDGHDFVIGGKGVDRVRGGPGSDQVSGSIGAGDRISGGLGRDTLYGRDGRRDFLHGGPGADRARVDRRLDRVAGIESFF